MRILVVEDDKELNRQISEALTDAGYVVDKAFDGEEGHFLGDTEPYDAVVLDIGLPQMDGISVVERWRRDGKQDAGADADRARPLERQGVGHRRRRRRLCDQAVPYRGSAGARAGADPARRRPRFVRAFLRAAAGSTPRRRRPTSTASR